MNTQNIIKFLLLLVITGIINFQSITLCYAEDLIMDEPLILMPIDNKSTKLNQQTNNLELTGYKNITPNIDDYSFDYDLDPVTLVHKIQNLDNDIEEYLKKDNVSLIDKEKIYIMYIKNLRFCISLINLETSVIPSEFIDDWEFSKFNYNHVNYIIKNAKISFDYPYNCKSITTWVWAGEDTFIYPIIDAQYQYKLSLYLDTSWQNYWRIKNLEQKSLDGSANIYSDGERVVTLNTLAEWIIAWNNFQHQNKKVELNEEAEEKINLYLNAFMYPIVYDNDNWGEYIENDYTIPYPTRPLTIVGRITFERLMKNLPADTYSYHIINKAYTILKNNDYMTSQEYYNALP